VLYELHVGTFSEAGTFVGAVDHLDHLVDLGVTTIELMPVAEFPGTRGWGYDGVDLFAPHHAYGGPDGLRVLVDACHQRGLGVVLDVVYNHLGPDGNYLAAFGPYFTDRHHTPWGDAVNLDEAEVRAFIVDNARMWLSDYGVDGLRLDAVHALHDESVVHEIAAACPDRFLIAEHEHHNPGLDGHWFDDVHHAIHALLTGERDGYYQRFGSLDVLVTALREADATEVTCTQNHDQIGNRAQGDRLCHLVSDAQARIAAALVLLGAGTPMLFMGEEWAASTPFQYFTDHQDPQLAQAVRDGRRNEFRAFGWKPEQVPDPQDPATFARSRLRWDEVGRSRHREMHAFYRDLIALRRSTGEVECDVRRVGTSQLEMHRGDVTVRVDFATDSIVIDS
jgi:maltooligosyltrehalose trehalohydrolase